MEYSINGLKIYTRGYKNNVPIIFIHGFPYDHSMWDYQVDQLKESYYCVTYDVRGFGSSTKIEFPNCRCGNSASHP